MLLIQPAKDKVSFMIFNAGAIEEIKGFLKSASSPDRKIAAIKEGEAFDYALLTDLLRQASESL